MSSVGQTPSPASRFTGRLAWLVLAAAIVAAGAAAWIKTARDNAPVAQDIQTGRYELAFAKLKKPAEEGDAWSQNQLGNLYYLGMGVCASSDNLGRLSGVSFGGSGSSLIEFMRFQFGGAIAA